MNIFPKEKNSTSMRFITIWSYLPTMRGLVIDLCKNTQEEIENVGMETFFHCLEEPTDCGVWVWEGKIQTHRLPEGDYDCDYAGKWSLPTEEDKKTVIENLFPEGV